MKLSDYLAEFISRQQVNHVFQIIGGAAVHMVHSIADRKDLDYICMQHEQAAAMAAEAYSRVTNNIGVAMATSGPGMTNLITGIGCAYFDSIPVLYITGQVNTYESKQGRLVRQIGFQETDIVNIVKSLTKFAVRVDKPELIRYYLEKALYIAKSGRCGPVLVDIPMDIQRAVINANKLKKFNVSEIKLDEDTTIQIEKKINKFLKLLEKSNRPILIAGGGIRYANQTKNFEELVNLLKIPVVSTWSGIDVLPHDHPLYVGQIGVYGSRSANFAVQNSDCIISIGARLDTRVTGGRPETFARKAKKIVIDVDRAELFKHRGFEPDIAICTNVKTFFPIFNKLFKKSYVLDTKEWSKHINHWQKKYPIMDTKNLVKKNVDPYFFMKTLSEAMPSNALIFADTGANLVWMMQAFSIKKGQRLISALGNSPMGYSFPASIGAGMISKQPVICITGDGGFQLNIQELQTLKQYNVPIKVFIVNNKSYGIIKQFQDFYFESRYEASSEEKGYTVPNLLKVVKAYGIATVKISSSNNLLKKIEKVLLKKGSVVCEIVVSPEAKINPRLPFGKPIEDLHPLLSRKEFAQTMLIPPVAEK